MTDSVWISIASLNPDRGLWMMSDPVPGDQPYPGGFQARNEDGDVLGPECFPKTMWHGGERELTSIPDLFQGKNGFVLSAKAAELLRQFDLGAGSLYPVELFKRDRLTHIDGKYVFLNIGNRKEAFAPEKSPRARTSSGGGMGAARIAQG